MNAQTFDLIVKSTDMMLHFPGLSVKQRAKNVIKRILSRPVPQPDSKGWKRAVGALGLLEFVINNPKDEVTPQVIKSLCVFFDTFAEEGGAAKVEDYLGAYVLVRFLNFLERGFGCQSEKEQSEGTSQVSNEAIKIAVEDLKEYDSTVRKSYENLKSARTDSQGVYIYNAARPENYVLADMLGMAVPFLVEYSKRYSDDEAMAIARRQYELFIKNALDETTGLVYHGYEYLGDAPSETSDAGKGADGSEGICANEDRIDKLGIVGWGRAMGWLMLSGMADDAMVNAVAGYQRADGLFGWKLCPEKTPEEEKSADCLENIHPDTSATAMIVYSLLRDGRKEKYKDLIDRAVEGLSKNITASGDVLNAQAECLGLGLHPMKFGSYPWSVGMTLAVMSLYNAGI